MSERITITDKYRKEIKAHVERTGVGASSILERGGRALHDLSNRATTDLLSGRLKTIEKKYHGPLLETWKSLPDSTRLKNTKARREKLKHHIERSRVGAFAIQDYIQNPPHGLSGASISLFLDGGLKTIEKSNYDLLLKTWEPLLSVKLTKITTAFRNKIKKNIARTEMGAQAILRGRKDKPKDFKASVITGIVKGTVKETSPEFYSYIDGLWDGVPGWITLTEKMVKHIRAERMRTGIGVPTLLKLTENIPKGLNNGKIAGWLSYSSKKAREHYYDFLSAAYAAQPDMPDDHKKKMHLHKNHSAKVLLSEDLLKKMRSEWDRTGIGPSALARRLPSDKQYLKGKISLWLNRRSGHALKDDIELIYQIWESLPDKKAKPAPIKKREVSWPGYVTISEQELATLRTERDRTNVGGVKLMHYAGNPPDSLSGYTIQSWLGGAVKTAPKQSIDYVINLYQTLPNKN